MKRLYILALCLLAGCSEAPASTNSPDGALLDGKADRYDKSPELVLVEEYDLEDLLEHPDTSRFEGSGVAFSAGRIYVVFDNLRRFVSLDTSFGDAQWLGEADAYGLKADPDVEDLDDFQGFEGVAVNPKSGALSLAIEAMETKREEVHPLVVHWTEAESQIEWIDYELETLNKGIEGLAYLSIDGHTWLAALCETGKCDGRNRGRLVLKDESGISYVNLPKGLDFIDFSGLAIHDDHIAVVSQESSRVWTGFAYLNEDGEIDFDTEGVFNLPRQSDGDVDYCTVEGLAWLDSDTLIAVSDLEKSGQKNRCKNHAEQLHVFDLPQ